AESPSAIDAPVTVALVFVANLPAGLDALSRHRAAARSPMLKDLVGHRGHLPAARLDPPREAHRFLQDVPTFEAAGGLVRVPDWWRKDRPRPTRGQRHRRRSATFHPGHPGPGRAPRLLGSRHD